jgi:hypothetical protein
VEADAVIAVLRAAGLHPRELDTSSHFSFAGADVSYHVEVGQGLPSASGWIGLKPLPLVRMFSGHHDRFVFGLESRTSSGSGWGAAPKPAPTPPPWRHRVTLLVGFPHGWNGPTPPQPIDLTSVVSIMGSGLPGRGGRADPGLDWPSRLGCRRVIWLTTATLTIKDFGPHPQTCRMRHIFCVTSHPASNL